MLYVRVFVTFGDGKEVVAALSSTYDCSVGSVHVTDCSRAKHVSTCMYVGMTRMYVMCNV